MGPPGVQPDTHQRQPLPAPQHLIGQLRRAHVLPRLRRHIGAPPDGIPPQQVRHHAPLRHAVDHRQILLAEGAAANLLRQQGRRLGRPGVDHQPADGSVQPVYRADAGGPQFLPQQLGHPAGLVGAQHPGRLHRHHDAWVCVNDLHGASLPYHSSSILYPTTSRLRLQESPFHLPPGVL